MNERATPLYPTDPSHGETARHFIGAAAPITTPKGVRYETGNDAPVELWVVEHCTPSLGRWVSFERNCDPASPPGDRNDCKVREMTLADLCDSLRQDPQRRGAWLRRGFSRIAAEALNRGALPEWELNFVARCHGAELLRAIFDEAGVTLGAHAQCRLADLADTLPGPTATITDVTPTSPTGTPR